MGRVRIQKACDEVGRERLRASSVHRILAVQYPDTRPELDFQNPFELLIATILSAQSTDAQVNRVTPGLFSRHPDARSLALARVSDIERIIHSTGFFRAKARAILGCARALEREFGGRVPRTMEELVRLPGVGRKTANVVLGSAFGVPGVVVDTHVQRVSQRLGLTEASQPEKIERDLMRLLPRKDWTPFSHRMIFHGRRVCHARKPTCDQCPIAYLCPSFPYP
jgi:endonuclease-3